MASLYLITLILLGFLNTCVLGRNDGLQQNLHEEPRPALPRQCSSNAECIQLGQPLLPPRRRSVSRSADRNRLPRVDNALAGTYGETGQIVSVTVNANGNYSFDVSGAGGGGQERGLVGTGGRGARVTGVAYLTVGDVINIAVGVRPFDTREQSAVQTGGGGGGSFIYRSGSATPDVIMVGGGGGGSRALYQAPADGSLTPDGTAGVGPRGGPGGTGGSGGGVLERNPQSTGGGGAGGGVLTDGASGPIYPGGRRAGGGGSLKNGLFGGVPPVTNPGCAGGFGGGGACHQADGGGGGGGYSGGGGGQRVFEPEGAGGGGGGSYASSEVKAAVISLTTVSGPGQVIIQYLG